MLQGIVKTVSDSCVDDFSPQSATRQACNYVLHETGGYEQRMYPAVGWAFFVCDGHMNNTLGNFTEE